MKNEMIGEVLRKFRQKRKYSIKDVRKLLKEHYITVAEKTIYSWESGNSQPDVDTLFVLCKIYNIHDVLKTFGYSEKENLSFTQDEEQLIINYRNHPELHYVINLLLGI